MRIREADHGVGGAIGDVAAHAKSIVRLELRLAAIELRAKLAALGTGAALAIAAGLLGLFAVGFGLATIAAALATVLPTWLALLIVTLVCAALAGASGAVAVPLLRQGAPPVPKQAIEDAKLTAEAVTHGS